MDFKLLQDRLSLSSADMARRLGVSDGYVADLRSGRRKLSLRLAAQLEELTGEPVVASVLARKIEARA